MIVRCQMLYLKLTSVTCPGWRLLLMHLKVDRRTAMDVSGSVSGKIPSSFVFTSAWRCLSGETQRQDFGFRECQSKFAYSGPELWALVPW